MLRSGFRFILPRWRTLCHLGGYGVLLWLYLADPPHAAAYALLLVGSLPVPHRG